MKLELRFRIVPTLCTIALMPVLISLGFWQLDRAQQKIEILELYESRFYSPPVSIGSTIESAPELEYRRVEANGSWDPQHEFLLDNRVLNGQPGFHVITPLIFRGDQSGVLVNRGWIPGSPDRSQLPQIDSLQGSAMVKGTAVIPPEDTFVLKDPPPLHADDWQSIWQVLDIERFATAVPYQVQGVVLQLDAEHPDGFERQWAPPDNTWIVRHKAYAFQWFALSVTLAVIYFLLTIRPRRN